MTVNWKAMQAYGCLQPEFEVPHQVIPGNMAGGSWRASLHRGGVKAKPSSGGTPKPKKRSKPRVTQLPSLYQFDKSGFVIGML